MSLLLIILIGATYLFQIKFCTLYRQLELVTKHVFKIKKCCVFPYNTQHSKHLSSIVFFFFAAASRLSLAADTAMTVSAKTIFTSGALANANEGVKTNRTPSCSRVRRTSCHLTVPICCVICRFDMFK